MFRILPQWICKLRDDLEMAVDEIAYDYGIDRQTTKDSASIKASISNIVGNMEYTAGIQRKDIKPQMWYTNRKFGGKREQANDEEKKERQLFAKRSRAVEKKTKTASNKKGNRNISSRVK